MGIYALKPGFRRMLGPLLSAAGRFHPHTLSGFSIICAAAAGAMLAWAPAWPWLYLVVPLALLLRITFNALDGMVAQARHLASPQGELVNEFSDRVNDALILGGLLLGGVAAERLVWLAITGTFLVTFLGVLPRGAGGARRYEGPLGKADRMLLLGLASLAAYVGPRSGLAEAMVWQYALWTWIALAGATLINRWLRAWRDLEAT